MKNTHRAVTLPSFNPDAGQPTTTIPPEAEIDVVLVSLYGVLSASSGGASFQLSVILGGLTLYNWFSADEDTTDPGISPVSFLPGVKATVLSSGEMLHSLPAGGLYIPQGASCQLSLLNAAGGESMSDLIACVRRAPAWNIELASPSQRSGHMVKA